MLFFGHKFIENESLYNISSVDAIAHTPPNATIYMKFKEENLDLINYAKENGVTFALGVSNITELLYAAALGAKYIVLAKELSKTAQKVAESYLLDAKVIAKIEDEDEIEELAILGIDGVLFPSAIIKINS